MLRAGEDINACVARALCALCLTDVSDASELIVLDTRAISYATVYV